MLAEVVTNRSVQRRAHVYDELERLQDLSTRQILIEATDSERRTSDAFNLVHRCDLREHGRSQGGFAGRRHYARTVQEDWTDDHRM